METRKKGKRGCLLLVLSLLTYSVGGILVMGSSHPAPGTPVRSGQFNSGVILTLLGMAAFPVGVFWALTAGVEWLVYRRRRSSGLTKETVDAIAAPSGVAPSAEEGDRENQTVR